jgi:hypothetical protein
MFLDFTRPSDSRDILHVHHLAGAFFEKVRPGTQKAIFDGIFHENLRVMKVMMVLDTPDGSNEKSR